MKRIALIITIALLSSKSLFAQERQTVYSIAKELREESWYKTQQSLWADETVKNKQNAEAWYNYYSATRALKNISQDTTIYRNYKNECTRIANQAYKEVPNTFEGNHLMWWDSGNDETKRSFLLKAHEIAPDDTRAFDDLMIYYEILRDKPNFNKMCMKMYEISELPASLMNWGYNVLAELDENAIVFVQGDNDTYALWLTQSVKQFRTDVTIVNTSLIKMDEYRDRMLKELKYKPYAGKNLDLLSFMIRNGNGRSIHVSSSAIEVFKNSPEMESLYLIGLTYKYSTEMFDNVSVIRRNYEKRYLLDYLSEQFVVHPSDDIAEGFDALYLPSMVKLYWHYEASEEKEAMENLKELIDRIAKRTGSEDKVKELITK